MLLLLANRARIFKEICVLGLRVVQLSFYEQVKITIFSRVVQIYRVCESRI